MLALWLYVTSLIQLIVNVISGTFEFFMLVGWEPSLTNLHASLINDPHHHHINHQTVYIVATGCLKTIKRVHRLKYKNSCSFHKFTKDKHRIFLPWNWEEKLLMLLSLPLTLPLRFLFLFRAFWIGSRRLW